MLHLEELSENGKQIHSKIVGVLEKLGSSTEPACVIKAASDTLEKLVAQRAPKETISDVLQIIISHRDYVEYSDELFDRLEKSFNINMCLTLSIIKSCIRNSNGNLGQAHTRIVNFLLSKSTFPSVRFVLGKYLNIPKEQLAALEMGKGVQKEAAILNGDALRFRSALETKVASGEETNEFIHHFLKTVTDLDTDVIEVTINSLKVEHRTNYEILSALLQFNRRNSAAYHLNKNEERRRPLLAAPQKFVDIMTYLSMECRFSEGKLCELFSLCPNLIFPSFIPFIRQINEIFISESKFILLLKSIVGHIGIEAFIEIVEPIDIVKHYSIFKGLSNSDLSTFVRLYGEYSGDEDQRRTGCLMACLPHFCNYATDAENKMEQLISIMRMHLRGENDRRRFTSCICSAIENFVHSQRLNLTSQAILNNPVTKEESQRMLGQLAASGIVDDVITAFVESVNNECDRALGLLIELTGLDLSEQLATAIQNPESSSLGLYASLRLMAFFAHRWVYNYDLIATLVPLCSSAENNISKRAYFLLYSIVNAQSVPCFCEMLFGAGMISQSSTRNRLMLLVAIVRRGCVNCKCLDLQIRMFEELVKYSKSGNVKARKFAQEIFSELAGSAVLREFLLSHLNTDEEDLELVAGCLEGVRQVLESVGASSELAKADDTNRDSVAAVTNVTAVDGNGQFVHDCYNKISQIAFHSESFVKTIIRIFTQMLGFSVCGAYADSITFILSKYIAKYNKKFNNELRECVYAAKNNQHTITKEMALLMKYKNKGGESKPIQVLKSRTN